MGCSLKGNVTTDEIIKAIRKECRSLGIKLTVERLSWGRQCNYTLVTEDGHEFCTRRTLVPPWWNASHKATLDKLEELRKRYRDKATDVYDHLTV